MKIALATLLVVAILVVLFYAARSEANAMPVPEPAPPPPPEYSVRPTTMPVTTYTVERTAEEIWRARVMLAAQSYQRAAAAYADRFPEAGRNALRAANAILAAAPLSSRVQLIARIAFASPPPAGAGAATRAWDELGAAVRAPIEFRPELPPVVVQTGIVPIGDFTL